MNFGIQEKCMSIGWDESDRTLICHRPRGHGGDFCYDPPTDQEFVPEYRKYPIKKKQWSLENDGW